MEHTSVEIQDMGNTSQPLFTYQRIDGASRWHTRAGVDPRGSCVFKFRSSRFQSFSLASCTLWALSLLVLVLPSMAFAQQLSVIDLTTASSPDAIRQAQTALANRSAIIRVAGGTEADIKRLIGVQVGRATVKAASGTRPIGAAAVRAAGQPLTLQAMAAYTDANGTVRTAQAYAPGSATANTEAGWRKSLDSWTTREQSRASAGGTLPGDPEPPAQAWTLLLMETIFGGSSGGQASGGDAQTSVGVYRLNSNDLKYDYYMVTVAPQTTPDFDGTCNGLVCSWHTTARTTFMSPVVISPTVPGGANLVDHGPTGTISSSGASFSIGGNLDAGGPGVNASYSASWSQPDMVTVDNSTSTEGVWQESVTFPGLSQPCDPTSAPGVSTGTFLSYQAGIFQVPIGTSGVEVPLETDSHLCNFNFFRSPENWFQYGVISIGIDEQLGPPLLVAYPSSLTVPANGLATLAVEASIPGSSSGFAWTITLPTNADWLTIPGGLGPFANGQPIQVNVAGGTKNGTTAILLLNSYPAPFAAPSVRNGPLQVPVTVGTPKAQLSGGVLLFGGTGFANNGNTASTSQVYDFATKTVLTTTPPAVVREGHTATLLLSGDILIAGGSTSPETPGLPQPVTASAELYHPSSLSYLPTGSLNVARQAHTATMLPDGKVLITGGVDINENPLSSAEVYNPGTGKFTPTGDMLVGLQQHRASLISDPGKPVKVIVYGGFIADGSENKTSEVWDETTGKFAESAQLPSGVVYFPQPAPLASGDLDLAGGLQNNVASAGEILLTPGDSPSFTRSAVSMNHPRYLHTLTALPGEQGLLVTGGLDPSGSVLDDAEIRDALQWTELDAKLVPGRTDHTATLLPDGTVLLAGGLAAGSSGGLGSQLGSTEFYDPATKLFSQGPTIYPRSGHTATLFSLSVTTLTVDQPTPSSGQKVTFTATVAVAAGTPRGTVQFLDNGSTVLGTATLGDGGQASFTDGTLAVGPHSITALYPGDGLNSQSTSAPVPLTVSDASSATSLGVQPNPSNPGQNVMLIAVVKGQAGGATPTGSVTFSDGTTELKTVTLDQGAATYGTTALAIGTHALTARYGGDSDYGVSTSLPVSQQVVQLASTTTTLTVSPPSPAYGDTITLTGMVTGPAPVPTGTLVFAEGTKILGSLTLPKTELQLTSLDAGMHSVVASYLGDSDHSISRSSSESVTVKPAATAIMLKSSLNPSDDGKQVTFTATVSSPSHGAEAPAGTVTFSNDGGVLGNSPIAAGGVATFSTTTLSVGTHKITATYGADQDPNFAGSSGTITQTVNSTTAKIGTKINLTSSPNPSDDGQLVMFQIEVAPDSGTVAPAGIVRLKNGSDSLGTATLVGGSAGVSTSALLPGSNPIIATYDGDPNFVGSTGTITQVVKFPSTAVITSSAPNPSTVGQEVTFMVKVTSTGGGIPTGSVTISEPLRNENLVYGDAPLVNGVATVVSNLLAFTQGTHYLAVTYGGDTTHTSTHTEADFKQTVNK
jgi:hypothetical protein